MNECRRSLECINFGSFENCAQLVTIPVGCSHYVKDRELSSYSTADLVAELEQRECVECIDVKWNEWTYEISMKGMKDGYPYEYNSDGKGPAKIIVVRGE